MKKYAGAHRVKDVPGMAQISIDLKPNRSVSDVYINRKMDLTELVRYVEKQKKAGKEINPICSVIKSKPEAFLETFFKMQEDNKCCC